ncbi:unnamed protein product [Sphagnum tenellum]
MISRSGFQYTIEAMDRVLYRLNLIPDHHIQLGAVLLELDLHAIDLSGCLAVSRPDGSEYGVNMHPSFSADD